MDAVNEDKAGVFVCEVMWNQWLVLETVIQLVFRINKSAVIFLVF